jgi:hypothetical protein
MAAPPTPTTPSQSLYILGLPEENNAVINTLPLVLYSENVREPQFKYVLDVYNANDMSQRLTRIKLASNANFNGGVGTIDLAPLVRDYLSYDKPWYTSGSTFTQNINANRFNFIGGEEYAPTPSGSTVVRDGLGNIGEPAVTCSQNNLFLIVNEYDEGSYDWDFEAYAGRVLSNNPNRGNDRVTGVEKKASFGTPIYDNDWDTLTFIDNISGSQAIEFNSIEITVYSGSTTIAYEDILVTASVDNNQNMLRYIGSGPNNLKATSSNLRNAFLTGSWTSYNVYTDITVKNNAEDRFSDHWYYNAGCQNYDRVRFAFINKFGTWDYYNIDLPLSKQTQIKPRKTVTRTHFQSQDLYAVDFSGSVPILVGDIYDINSRGLDNYYAQPSDEFLIASDWLDEDEANWLTELSDSPDVYVQIGKTFQPVNLTSVTYNWKTNKRGQKVFKYDIEYKLSNQRTAR